MAKITRDNLDGYQSLALNRTLDRIATDILFMETLETRKSDSLDFHDLAVWIIKEALETAYIAGLNAAAGEPEPVKQKSEPRTRSTPYERTRAAVHATGNKWAIENFNATHG